jgi:hypothetical protein
MFYALAKDQDFWNERINTFVALAPGIIPSTDSKLFEILAGFDKFEQTCSAAGLYELGGKDWSHKFDIVKAISPDVMN